MPIENENQVIDIVQRAIRDGRIQVLRLNGSNAPIESPVRFNTSEIYLANLPTSDPGVAGQLWNNSGTPEISAG